MNVAFWSLLMYIALPNEIPKLHFTRFVTLCQMDRTDKFSRIEEVPTHRLNLSLDYLVSVTAHSW